jgi:hypothetical protein
MTTASAVPSRKWLPPATRRGVTIGQLGIAAAGCAFALVMGAAAVTSHADLIAGALIAIAFCGVGIAVYFHDPIEALIGLWLIAIFNGPVSASVGYFSSAGEAVRQSDEILTLLFLCLTLWQTARSNVQMPPLRFILTGVGVAVLGLLGNALHDVPLVVTMVGTWLGLKLWVMVGVTLLLPWKLSDLERVYRVFARVGVIVAVLGLADYFTHEAVSRALGTSVYTYSSETFRGEAIHSIFPHPGEYSVFMSLLFACAFARFSTQRRTSDLLLVLLFAVSIMLSLRLKGFLSLAAVMLIVATVQALSNKRGTLTILTIGALLFAGVYSVEGNVIAKQFSTYTSSQTTARARLYKTGENIAKNEFPLGAGFGRFASYASRIFYSPVYKQYELNSVWGLSRKYPQFIDDTSWPSVIGETGYGGLVIYLAGIAFLVLAVIRRLRTATAETRWAPLATLCAIAAFLIDSLGEATLFDWVSVITLALLIGPTLVATPSHRNGPRRFASDFDAKAGPRRERTAIPAGGTLRRYGQR